MKISNKKGDKIMNKEDLTISMCLSKMDSVTNHRISYLNRPTITSDEVSMQSERIKQLQVRLNGLKRALYFNIGEIKMGFVSRSSTKINEALKQAEIELSPGLDCGI